jgi:hypothetical protein
MKKSGKKLLSYLLALVLVLGLVPWISLTAKAEQIAISIIDAKAVDRTYEPGNKNVTINHIVFMDNVNGYILYLVKGRDYEVTGIMKDDKVGENKPVDVTVMLKDHDAYKLLSNTTTTTVNITEATPPTGDFTYEATTSLEYDGTEKTANVTSDKTGMGKITVGYYSDEECKTPVTPTAVGTYYVAIDVGEGTNYSAASRLHDPSWTFTINKATPPTGDFAFTEPTGSVDMFRLYNPNTGEHFYTGNEGEKDHLVSLGWNFEGIAFFVYDAESGQGNPEYRVYNPNTGAHHWTSDAAEKDALVALGWNDEGVAWNVK